MKDFLDWMSVVFIFCFVWMLIDGPETVAQRLGQSVATFLTAVEAR